eukprot:UN07258
MHDSNLLGKLLESITYNNDILSLSFEIIHGLEEYDCVHIRLNDKSRFTRPMFACPEAVNCNNMSYLDAYKY